MEFISVIVAAIASYAFGAVWYMLLSKPWMEAADVTEEQVNSGAKSAYVIAFVSAILVAGMMRHVFAGSGVDTVGKGLISGLGMGLFIASPWLATCYSFGNRPRKLIAIDAGYIICGSAIMGLVLSLF